MHWVVQKKAGLKCTIPKANLRTTLLTIGSTKRKVEDSDITDPHRNISFLLDRDFSKLGNNSKKIMWYEPSKLWHWKKKYFLNLSINFLKFQPCYKKKKSYLSIPSVKKILLNWCHMKRPRLWARNVFLLFVLFVSFFKYVIGYDSFLVLNKCSFIPNLVFMIPILLKNGISFRSLQICPQSDSQRWLTSGLHPCNS